MDQNQNQVENRGQFVNSMSLAMAKIKYGITSVKKGTQECRDGKPRTAFVCFNAKGQEVIRGLVSSKMAGEEKIAKNAYISEVAYEKADGTPASCMMLHHAASQLELADFEEE